MATINYQLRTKNNPAKIYVRVKEGREIDIKAPTTFLINPIDWMQGKGQPRLNDDTLKKLKNKLNKLEGKIKDALNERKPGDIINTQWIKDIITPPEPKESQSIPNTLVEYFEVYHEYKKNELSLRSAQRIGVIKNLLTRYQEQVKQTLFIKDINLDFKTKFEQYCIDNNYAPNTISRSLRFVKTVC